MTRRAPNPPSTARRALVASIAALPGLAAPGLARRAHAQEFPVAGRPIRIVVPFPPGGQTDIQARQAAPLLGELLGGASVVVENKPGGNMVIAAQDVQRAAPDGHTLLYANAGMFTRNPFLFANLPYDALKDFTPITQYVAARNILTAHADLPGATLAEMVQRARGGRPLKYGVAGIGSNSHVLMELLRQQSRLDLTMVPYKGTADAQRDLIGGTIDLYVDGTQTALAQAKGGRIKMLGITGAARLPVAPELPTFVEQGFERMNILGWIGFFGPAGMSPATVARLNGALARVIERPDVAGAIRAGGNEPVGGSPDALRAALAAEHAQMQQLFAQLDLPKQ